MVSAQRLIEYINMDVEAQLLVASNPAHKDWKPKSGQISLKNVSMRYNADLPLVLKDVDLEIEAGSKVGVVGRTGSGKSSLILAIFRMVELETGSEIQIGGDNIFEVPVRTMRGALGMIPQDTFMFSGTLRSNLDVSNEYTDEQLWAALEKVSLKAPFEEYEDKLEHEVQEKGSNLSAGTVQLVCLARVLLKNPSIIFMDEATASVDLATDTLVQDTIRTSFADATIVTIAHRLNTVIDFDKIVVMDAGVVAEHGSPSELLAKEGGLFSKLVDSTGADSAAELRSRANAAAK